MRHWRTTIAFLIAPTVASVIFLAFGALLDSQSGDFNWERLAIHADWHFAYAYAVAIILGVPTYFILTVSQRLTAIFIPLAAAAMATFPVLLFWSQALEDGDTADQRAIWFRLAILAAEGLVAGVVFWFVVRPDLRPASGDPSTRMPPLDWFIALSWMAIVLLLFSFAVIPVALLLLAVFTSV